ncbi:MAG: hypothetical protein KAQ92_08520 [Candidatus Aenigmarchaeota archaeon]|nr:hypothetical protein [Candidatus Aenigmarchaeota archaeon]
MENKQKIGYIGITDSNWYGFNKGKNHTEVVFWRKTAKIPLKNMSIGIPFFFLVKGTPRYIRGYGFVKLTGSDKVKDLWGKYGEEMGADSLSSVVSILKKKSNARAGYYILENVKYTDRRIDLNDLNIKFNRNTQPGRYFRKYEEEDIRKLLSFFGDESKYRPIKIEDSFQRKKHSKKE